MNHLNSIILEGFVHGYYLLENGVGNFTIRSDRFVAKDKEKIKKQVEIEIAVSGKLAKSLNENITDGRGVRLIGCLDFENGKYRIVANHIEFRPQFSEGE